MSVGINSSQIDLEGLLRNILDRLSRLEQPNSVHYGPVGGALSSSQGYTFSVETAPPHRLIVTSDAGTVSILALP